jgi:hypothetical protein
MLSLLLGVATAHRSLPSGVTCGNQFSSPDDALNIPDPLISWATYRIVTCDAPVAWWKGHFDAGQNIEYTLGVPVLERFVDTRVAVVIIGPGLPTLVDDAEVVPQEISYDIGDGEGAVLMVAPEDQSTCDHIKSEEMRTHTDIKDDKCHFYEEYGGAHSWVQIDEQLFAADAGVYRFAVFNTKKTTTKLWFACCDWPEDFTTPHEIPVADCPYCGTKATFGKYMSHFYEQKDMVAHAGFPALQNCAVEPGLPAQPRDTQCPDETTVGIRVQPESCQLGCVNGECHSHNIFGECTYDLEWRTPHPVLGHSNVSKLVLFKGDSVFFKKAGWSDHNLVEAQSAEHLEKCDLRQHTERGNTEDIKGGIAIQFEEEGTHFYSCTFPDHCTMGQVLTVEVKDASEGQRCHEDHEEEELVVRLASEEDACPPGEVQAHVVGDASYGLRAAQCGEMCMMEAAMKWVEGGALGHCKDLDYTRYLESRRVQPDGSPVKVTVKIFEKPCADDLHQVRIVGNAEYGAQGMQCSEACFEMMAMAFLDTIDGAAGTCKDAGFPEYLHTTDVTPVGKPTMAVHVYAKPSNCHCHSYEEIKCDEEGQDLYDEHVDELREHCAGIIAGTAATCPYKCFQPFEVMHLYYMECSTRPVHNLFKLIEATGQCHKAARLPAGQQCGTTTLEPTTTTTMPQSDSGVAAAALLGTMLLQ